MKNPTTAHAPSPNASPSKPPFSTRNRGEKLAQAAGVFVQSLVLAVLILSALWVLLSYVGTQVVFRYQNF